MSITPDPPANLVPEAVEITTKHGETVHIWMPTDESANAWSLASQFLADITNGDYTMKVDSWIEPTKED